MISLLLMIMHLICYLFTKDLLFPGYWVLIPLILIEGIVELAIYGSISQNKNIDKK